MSGRRSSVTWAAASVVALVALVALVGPWLTPHDPDDGELRSALEGPSGAHWLGTDYLGRDTLSRIIAGSRVAAIAGVEATVVALVLGVSIGMIIGLVGGWTDRVAMRLIEAASAIPALVLAIAIIAALGSGLTRSMLAVGIAFAMSMARLARGLTLSERERLYVDGARVVGAGRTRLLWRHIVPNVAGPIAVQATLVFASAITIEASLSFLGLGVQPPASSWGSMLSSAQRTIRQAPFQAIPPGLAIVLTVLSINVLGDAVVRRRRGESYDHPTGYLEPITIAATGTGFAPGTDDTRPALLRASGVSVRYGSNLAVDRADIEIAPGEVVALVGESGSGKTSLAMALAGLLTPPAAATADEVHLATPDGSADLLDARSIDPQRWRSHIGVVFQEPSASLNPLQTIRRQLRDVILAQRRERGASAEGETGIDARVTELLSAVGLPQPVEVARLRPGQISGGMAQRVMIALALAKEPELLIADEPTTALDVTVQAEIIRLLRRLCRERHFAVLLVTHDLGVAGELADRCLVMFQGRVIESGPITSISLDPKHPYTSALVSSVPQNEPGRRILDTPVAAVDVGAGTVLVDTDVETGNDQSTGCSYRSRCPYPIDRCSIETPVSGAIDAAALGRTVACHRAGEFELASARAADQPAEGSALEERV